MKKTDLQGTKPTEPILHDLEPMKETKVTVNLPLIGVGLIIIFTGVFTGYVLAKGTKGTASSTSGSSSTSGVSKVVGNADEKTFKDNAEGILREGGTDSGEGTHHLERPGGPSQNVYLTSSSLPLDDYIDKKVKVWGETFAAQTAGWLMDAGRLELLE